MPPDHGRSLAAAAQRKRDRALERAHGALRDLDRRGETISFQSIARTAGVSRQWLYKQPELRAEIERLRTHHPSDAPRARCRACSRGVASPAQHDATG
jgi:hypothetical protein